MQKTNKFFIKIMLTFAVTFSAQLSGAASLEFKDLDSLKALNETDLVMSDGTIVDRKSLNFDQSYCGSYAGYDLPSQYTDPVKENTLYTINMRSMASNGDVKVFSLFSLDQKGFATGSFYCISVNEGNLSRIQILQKHLGKLVKISE